MILGTSLLVAATALLATMTVDTSGLLTAAYMVLAMCLTAMTKRTILPTGHFKKDRNVPGRQPLETVELPWAEPGIKQGQ